MRDIDEIIKVFSEEGVTGYQLQRDLPISQVGADKILNGSSKNPRKTTLKLLNDYIDNGFNPIDYEIKSSASQVEKVKYLENTKTNAIWVEHERFMMIPLVSHRAQAGFLSGWGDDEYLEELPKIPWEVDRNYKGKYMSFEVEGDSMDDGNPRTAILDRDILLTREVQRQHWTNHLHINKWNFVIVHREEGILVKRIVKHNTSNGVLTLHSLNPYYEDFEVNLNDVIAIFNVVDLHRKPLI